MTSVGAPRRRAHTTDKQQREEGLNAGFVEDSSSFGSYCLFIKKLSSTMMKRLIPILLVIAASSVSTAFVPPNSIVATTRSSSSSHNTAVVPSSSTSLSERKWNFNQGRGPFGLKKNAEIWNGRVAQMAFVIVLLQELITGKGVVASIQDGDAVGLAGLGFFAFSIVGLTAFLVSKGDESDIVF